MELDSLWLIELLIDVIYTQLLPDSCFSISICGYLPYGDKWALHLKHQAAFPTGRREEGQLEKSKRGMPVLPVLF